MRPVRARGQAQGACCVPGAGTRILPPPWVGGRPRLCPQPPAWELSVWDRRRHRPEWPVQPPQKVEGGLSSSLTLGLGCPRESVEPPILGWPLPSPRPTVHSPPPPDPSPAPTSPWPCAARPECLSVRALSAPRRFVLTWSPLACLPRKKRPGVPEPDSGSRTGPGPGAASGVT